MWIEVPSKLSLNFGEDMLLVLISQWLSENDFVSEITHLLFSFG